MNLFMRATILQKRDIAEHMNNHFCSLDTKLASGIPNTVSQPEDFLNRTDRRFNFLFSSCKCKIHSEPYI